MTFVIFTKAAKSIAVWIVTVIFMFFRASFYSITP